MKHDLDAILLVLSCAADDLRDVAAATRKSKKKTALEATEKHVRAAMNILMK